MKSVSHLAITLMLSLAATAAVATPATAKDQKPAADQTKLNVSPAFTKVGAAINAAMTAKDYATAETQLTAAEAIAKNDDEHYFIASTRLHIGAAKSDNAMIAQALEALAANPRTPPAEVAQYTFLRGSIAVDMKQYPEAISLLLKARQLGSTEPDLPVKLAQAYGGTHQIGNAVAELDKAITAEKAAGRKAPEAWYTYAVGNLFVSGDRSQASAWATRQLRDYPSVENWRKMIAIYRDSADKAGVRLSRPQRIDLYRLVRTSKAMTGPNDYHEYADDALQLGLPWETVSVIDEGRAAGALQGGFLADLYKSGQVAVSSESPLSVYEKQAQTAPTGTKASVTGDAYLASRNYAKAIELYALAETKGGINVDEVNIRRGYALVNLGRRDEARAVFAKVTSAPLADIAHFWLVWLDTPQLSG